MHRSVFLQEAVESLDVKQNGKYIDATYGEGGHSEEISKKGGIVLGIDADPHQVSKHADGAIKVIQGNFSEIESLAKNEQFEDVDGILFDLGLSMEQVSKGGKGLSYKNFDEPLDMRLGDSEMTVSSYIEHVELDELRSALMKYSEDLNAEKIADAIIRKRTAHPFQNVGDLIRVIDSVLEANHILGPEDRKRVYARIFQAFRIIVNNEFESIQKALNGSLALLKSQGRIVIITFHSLEDRIVKLFARENKLEQKRIDVEKKRHLAPFERSATLRILVTP